MHTAAYSALNVARPLRPVQLPSLRPVQLPSLRPRQLHAIDATATRSSHKVVLHAAADAAGDDAVDAPAPTGLRAKLKKAASFKKGDLAKYGVSAFFAYEAYNLAASPPLHPVLQVRDEHSRFRADLTAEQRKMPVLYDIPLAEVNERIFGNGGGDGGGGAGKRRRWRITVS